MDKKNTSISAENGPEFAKEHPFGLAWLDSAYLETLLPGSPWQNVICIQSQHNFV